MRGWAGRGAVLVVALAVLAPAACGGDDGGGPPESAGELTAVLRDSYGVSPERASCMAEQVFARLTEDEITEVRQRLAAEEELPAELTRKLRSAIVPCA